MSISLSFTFFLNHLHNRKYFEKSRGVDSRQDSLYNHSKRKGGVFHWIKNMKNLFSKSLNKKKVGNFYCKFHSFINNNRLYYYETTKNTVALTIDGQEKIIKTHAKTVQQLFDELEISIQSKDYVVPSKDTKITNNLKIVWKQAKQVQLSTKIREENRLDNSQNS